MTQIETYEQYEALLKRIEHLLEITDEDTPLDSPEMIELDILSKLISDYSDEHFAVGTPSLIDILKLRMFELGLTQKSLAELIGVSTSRINDYITGKCEPTLKIARIMKQKLNIDADIILGC